MDRYDTIAPDDQASQNGFGVQERLPPVFHVTRVTYGLSPHRLRSNSLLPPDEWKKVVTFQMAARCSSKSFWFGPSV
jgi:hypothetical protein